MVKGNAPISCFLADSYADGLWGIDILGKILSNCHTLGKYCLSNSHPLGKYCVSNSLPKGLKNTANPCKEEPDILNLQGCVF